MTIKWEYLWIFLLFLILSFSIRESWAQEKLVPFEKGGKWGYKNSHDKVVIEPQFIIAQDFTPEGIAAVVNTQGWAYINQKGEIIIRPFLFDNGPDPFEEGLARFTTNNKFGFFNRAGKVVIGPQFDYAAPFHEGLAVICEGCKEATEGEHRFMRGGKWGFIDTSGKIIIKPQFDYAMAFYEGLAAVCMKCRSPFDDGKWGYINNKGEIIIQTKFERAGDFVNGKAKVKLNGTWVYIDKRGREVSPMIESLIEELEDIDRQALEMVTTVVQHPALRSKLAEGAKLLSKRLLEIVNELKNNHPDTYQERADQISESILDLNFVEMDSVITSLRLGRYIDLLKAKSQQTKKVYDKPFPMPVDAHNITKTLKSDMVNFQTKLSLNEIASFYRRAFTEQEFSERKLFADYLSNEFINLIFEGLPDDMIIVVGAIDLAYSSDQNLRNVNIHTEEDTWK